MKLTPVRGRGALGLRQELVNISPKGLARFPLILRQLAERACIS
jgi:hypothetical protein